MYFVLISATHAIKYFKEIWGKNTWKNEFHVTKMLRRILSEQKWENKYKPWKLYKEVQSKRGLDGFQIRNSIKGLPLY